jgi:uncharacterized membrane protein
MIILDQPENADPQSEWKTPEEVIEQGYSFNATEIIGDAINIFKKDIGNFVLFTLLLAGIGLVLGLIPIIGQAASIVVNPPLAAGLIFVAEKIRRGEPYTFNSFFEGFNSKYFGNLIVISLITTVFIVIGTIFCILPGIFLAISYSIAVPMMLLIKSEFWDAMEASRKVVYAGFGSWFALILLVVLGAVVATLITCGIGILAIIPIVYLTFYAAFLRVMKR